MVTIGPIDDFGPLDQAIEDLKTFDWLVFTSSQRRRITSSTACLIGDAI